MTTKYTYGHISNRRLLPFLVGTALGNAGDLFTQIAILWTGYAITGRALSVAGLGAVWTLGAAFAGLVSGSIVDRFNRRNLLVYLHIALSLLCFGIFALSYRGPLRMAYLWTFLIVESLLGTPVTAAFTALLPDLVAKERLVRVNGLLSSWGMADNLIEAALSGIVLVTWGPAPIFLFNGIMYVIGASAALFVPVSAETPHSSSQRSRWTPWKDLRLTLRYIRGESLLTRVVTLDFLSDFAFAPLFFLPPVVASAVGMGAEGYGFFQSLTLGGILAGSLLASSFGTKWPKFRMWIGGNLLFAVAFLVLGLRMTPSVALIVFFIFGVGASGQRVYGATLVQQVLPSRIRGRVRGFQGFLGSVLQPVSLAIFMAAVDASRVDRVLVWLSLCLLLIALGYLLLLPHRDDAWIVANPDGQKLH